MRLPRINARGLAAPPGGAGLRVPADDQVAQAGAQLGQTLGNAAVRLSQNELRNARFEAQLAEKEDRATRNTVMRRSLFGLKEEAFKIKEGFIDDQEPETLAKRANKSLTDAATSFGSKITNEQDREQFQLQAQVLTQSLTTDARTIGISKMRDQGLAEGLVLGDEILNRFSTNPSISDEDFAAGIDSYNDFNKKLEDAGLISKVERQKLNSQFDDKLGGIVQAQDETLAVESGSHALMLQHLLRVQNGFYRIAPEDVPVVIEQAIARQSTHLSNLEIKEGKRATAREKAFNIAIDLRDAETASGIIGRPVSQEELETNMKGLVLEAFRKGIVKEPATVNAIEQEAVDREAGFLDTDKAEFTELLIKATSVKEVDDLIDELIAPEMKAAWNRVEGGADARRELIKEAASKKDKLIADVRAGRSDSNEILKKEIQLAEASLNAKKETGIFGAFGTKETNEKIATMKRLLHLKVKQGQKPFDALADLEKQFDKTPGKASTELLEGGSLDEAIPFTARQRFLTQSAPLTENQFDDQELKELIRFRDGFIKKTKSFVAIGQDQAAEEAEKARKEQEQRDSSILDSLKKLIQE